MKNAIAGYKDLIDEISYEVKEGILSEKDTIQILRSQEKYLNDYRPMLDWYYNAYTMDEELSTPMEQMFMEEDYSEEEWEDIKKNQEAYKKQYEEEKDKLEEITVKAALTEMKQMIKLFGK